MIRRLVRASSTLERDMKALSQQQIATTMSAAVATNLLGGSRSIPRRTNAILPDILCRTFREASDQAGKWFVPLVPNFYIHTKAWLDNGRMVLIQPQTERRTEHSSTNECWTYIPPLPEVEARG
jgi:hypothetical protein